MTEKVFPADIKVLDSVTAFLEEELEVPIRIVSVGPDREQTIERYQED